MVKKTAQKTMQKLKSVSKHSLDLTEENLLKLKKIFPEVFSEEKIDFEKLKVLLGSEIEDSVEKYNFTWAGRSNSFRNIQTTAKGTLIPDEKDSVNFNETENLFIEGDNLEVLKLLQKSYQNKIKMIYIDPPYNTGKDFVYKDNFRDSIGNYEKITGQIDEDGNRTDTNKETNGRFHSDWLTMMYPRLYLAKNLLKDDGVIFVSIDDHEVHNLRKIMDDIFGEENFVAQFVTNSAPAGTQSSIYVAQQHSYCLTYKKSNKFITNKINLSSDEIDKKYTEEDEFGRYYIERLWKRGIGGKKEDVPSLHFPVYYDKKNNKIFIDDEAKDNKNLIKIIPYQTKGVLGRWTWSRTKMRNEKEKLIIKLISGEYKLHKKSYLSEANGKLPYTIVGANIARTELGSLELKNILSSKVFDYPKHSKFIQYFINFSTNKDSNDIILDFFAGSGTTAHAVLDLNKDGGNRKFICVQLPEKTDEKSEAYKAGYKTIAEISKERIRRVIGKIKEEDKEKAKKMDLGFKVFKLSKSNYKIWENYDGKDAKELLKQMELFQSPLIAGYKKIDLIYEILIKEGYDLNSKIEEVKGIKTNKVFKIDNGEKYFYICLDEKIKEQTIKDLNLGKETIFVCLDESLDDNQKINLSLKINLRGI